MESLYLRHLHYLSCQNYRKIPKKKWLFQRRVWYYIKYDKGFVSLGDLDPATVDLDTCVNLIKAKQEFDKQKLIKSFDFNETVIQICNGRYGIMLGG